MMSARVGIRHGRHMMCLSSRRVESARDRMYFVRILPRNSRADFAHWSILLQSL